MGSSGAGGGGPSYGSDPFMDDDPGPDPSWTQTSSSGKDDDEPCAATCWCGCDHCYDTFFVDAFDNASSTVYHLATVWGIHYPSQLHEALAQAGFRPADNDTGHVPQCQWTRAAKVYKTGVYRGWIDVQDGKNTTGDPMALARISAAMKHQYPFVEILIICSTLLLPLLTAIAICVLAWRHNESRYNYVDEGRSEKQKPKVATPGPVLTKLRKAKQSVASLYNRRKVSKLQKAEAPPLLRLPDELQINILDNVDFHDARRLRSSCKFYRRLVTDEMLQESRERHKTYLRTQEARKDYKPCWTCLHFRRINQFRSDQLPGFVGSRNCLTCEYKAGTIFKGRYYVVGVTGPSQSHFYYNNSVSRALMCPRCHKFGLVDHSQMHYSSISSNHRKDNLCETCHKLIEPVLMIAALLRGIQFPFAIILFAVACSGSFPFHLWAFAITVTMVSRQALIKKPCSYTYRLSSLQPLDYFISYRAASSCLERRYSARLFSSSNLCSGWESWLVSRTRGSDNVIHRTVMIAKLLLRLSLSGSSCKSNA